MAFGNYMNVACHSTIGGKSIGELLVLLLLMPILLHHSTSTLDYYAATPLLHYSATTTATTIGDDIKILQAGVHVVSGTPGRTYDMIQRKVS